MRVSPRKFPFGEVGAVGGGSVLGNVVVVGSPLFGRNIRLVRVPAKVPVKLDGIPSGWSAIAVSA